MQGVGGSNPSGCIMDNLTDYDNMISMLNTAGIEHISDNTKSFIEIQDEFITIEFHFDAIGNLTNMESW